MGDCDDDDDEDDDDDDNDDEDDDDNDNLLVHLCIMGMASTSDSFVFIYFGAQHTQHSYNGQSIYKKTGLEVCHLRFVHEHFPPSILWKFW